MRDGKVFTFNLHRRRVAAIGAKLFLHRLEELGVSL